MALVALSCGPFLTVPAPVLAGTPESEVQDGSALLVLNWTPGRPAASSRGRGPNDPSRRAWRAACGSGGCRSAVVSGARGVRSSPGRVALGMPPSPPGLGFLICEVGVTVGPLLRTRGVGTVTTAVAQSQAAWPVCALGLCLPRAAPGRAAGGGHGRGPHSESSCGRWGTRGHRQARRRDARAPRGSAGRPAALRARRVRVRPAGPGRGRGGPRRAWGAAHGRPRSPEATGRVAGSGLPAPSASVTAERLWPRRGGPAGGSQGCRCSLLPEDRPARGRTSLQSEHAGQSQPKTTRR